jgi:RNA polymerase sigma-70 factor (ECF subfamily)
MYDRVARYAYARTGDPSGAEDIAGEVFLRALESLDSYQERGVPMQAWLFTIARNLVVDHLRNRSRHEVLRPDDVAVADGDAPMAGVESGMDLEQVEKAMQQLTSDQREVVALRFFGELSSAEVATIMGRKPGAVREMQRAAMNRLRRIVLNE